jgi:hypothetical protein
VHHVLRTCRWHERMQATRPVVREQEPLLAIRRAIYSMHPTNEYFRNLESTDWIHLAKISSSDGDYNMAARSITHAKLLHDPRATIEKAKLYKERGELHRAFLILEEESSLLRLGLSGVKKTSNNNKNNKDEKAKRDICTRLLLKADWTLEGGMSVKRFGSRL